MEFFKTYSSNTIGGSSNQFIFDTEGKTFVGRVFYKIRTGGKFPYSFLFSNIIDSTYSFGEVTTKNYVCDSWELFNAKAAVVDGAFFDGYAIDTAAALMDGMTDFCDITFGGAKSKTAKPGEFFSSDEIVLDIKKGDYLCIEIAVKGKEIPWHPECQLPVYCKTENGWEYNKHIPLPGMVGVNRNVSKRLVFFGDSITQGIGPGQNTYAHWSALIAENLPDEVACWNIGIGYGRANDAASCGAWMFKAKQNDYAIVCYGVNDINKGHSAEQIKKDFEIIIDKLQSAGIKVLLHTIPPYYYENGNFEKWQEVNDYIKNTLAAKADAFFDVVPYLVDPESPYGASRFGGHPNAEGSKIWADALLPVVKEFLEI